MKPHFLTVKVTRGSQIDVIGDVAEIVGISSTALTTPSTTTTFRTPITTTRAPYGSLKAKGKGGKKGGKGGGKKKMSPSTTTMSMNDVVLSHFQSNPGRVFHAKEVGAVVRSKGYRSDGHAAMAHFFSSNPNAPVEKVGRAIYKYKNGGDTAAVS